MSTPTRRAGPGVVATALLAAGMLLAGCGGSGGTSLADTEQTPGAQAGSAAPAALTGTLRTFTYLDTVKDKLLGPFAAANPGLDVQTATFDSDDEAAAKIKAGFQADVIEVCLDEAGPLLDAGALAPIDSSRLPHWGDLDPKFRDAEGITVDGSVIMVPLEAGAQGLIYDKATFPNGVDSFSALFDPQYAGRVALDGGYWLTPLAITALAHGNPSPMTMSDDQVVAAKDLLLANRGQFRSFASSDSDMANLFKSGEVVLSDGNRVVAQSISDDDGNVGWAAPKEGVLSWVCGLGISPDAENLDAAYAFINYYMTPKTQALFGNLGYVVMNPDAVPFVNAAHRDSADPTALSGAIAETQPANSKLWRQSWQEVKAG
jgi:spermidine/putrescine transport system substrate-binding protein